MIGVVDVNVIRVIGVDVIGAVDVVGVYLTGVLFYSGNKNLGRND